MRPLLLCTLLASASAFPGVQPATAQEGKGQVAFSIPAGPLGTALMAWGRQAGVQISYLDATTGGRTTPGLSSNLAPEEALARLLSGTGLHYSFTDARSVVITAPGGRASGATAAGDAILLDPIMVQSDAGDIAYATPGSVGHISTEQIERVATGNAADIFKSTPGVISAGNRIGPSVDVNIRGLQGQNRVNVMVDGTRQTGGSYRGYRGARNETYVDPDFLASVDIEKGPTTGAGGVGAMGGVVNMRTIGAEDIIAEGAVQGFRIRSSMASNTAPPQATGSTQIRAQDNGFNGDAWSGSLAWAMRRENFDLMMGVSRRESGNYFAGTKGASTYDISVFGLPSQERRLSPFGKGEEVFNTSQDVTTYLAKATWHWGDHSLRLGYSRYENQYGEIDETTLLFSIGAFIIPAAQNKLSRTTTDTVTVKYEYAPAGNDLIHLAANLWATQLDTFSSMVGTQVVGATGESAVRTIGGDVSNRSEIATAFGQLSTMTGAEFALERSRSDQITTVYPWTTIYQSFNPNGDRTLAGIFHRSTLEVNDWLSVSGGLRQDYYKVEGKGLVDSSADQSGSHFSKNAGLTVTPLDGLQFFATYAEGWRPPSLREQAAFGAGGLVINPDLKPETSTSIEIGANYLRDGLWRRDDRLRLKLVSFDGKYDDYIIRSRNATGAYTWGNIDQARFKGHELSASYDAGFAFVEGNLTRYDKVEFCNAGSCGLRTVATDYGVMTIPPEMTATLTAGVRMMEDRRLTLGARGYFIGERFGGYVTAPGAVNNPIYYRKNTIVDLFGSYRISDMASFDFSIENVADRYYIDPMAASISPAPGRTGRVSLTARF